MKKNIQRIFWVLLSAQVIGVASVARGAPMLNAGWAPLDHVSCMIDIIGQVAEPSPSTLPISGFSPIRIELLPSQTKNVFVYEIGQMQLVPSFERFFSHFRLVSTHLAAPEKTSDLPSYLRSKLTSQILLPRSFVSFALERFAAETNRTAGISIEVGLRERGFYGKFLFDFENVGPLRTWMFPIRLNQDPQAVDLMGVVQISCEQKLPN